MIRSWNSVVLKEKITFLLVFEEPSASCLTRMRRKVGEILGNRETLCLLPLTKEAFRYQLKACAESAQITLLISHAIMEDFHFHRQLKLSDKEDLIIKILTSFNAHFHFSWHK